VLHASAAGRLALCRHHADPLSLRGALRGAAVAHGEARAGSPGQSRRRDPDRAARRSVLADRARVSPYRPDCELARRHAAADARVDLAGVLRLAASRPRAPAAPRSGVRRGTGPHHRTRRAAKDRSLIMADVPRPHSANEHADVHHETSDANIVGVLGFGFGLLVAAIVIHLLVLVLFQFFKGREARRVPAEYP